MRLLLLCLFPLHMEICGEQLLNLPLPDDGLRYRSLEALQTRWPAKHGEAHICLWKDDKFAPVSVTIDDNNAPDIPFWRELSEEHGWKFTWFVIVHPYMWDIYAQQRESGTIKVDKVAPGEISFELGDRMHDELFDYPLTVKLRTEGWGKVFATQAGKPVPARIVEHGGASFTLVDAVPDRGPVVVRSL